MSHSKPFDFFTTKYYNKSIEEGIMNKFIKTNHNISQFVLACFVPQGISNVTHKNRPSHGLALNCGDEKHYFFSDGTTHIVKPNDIIYLPKNSTYTVMADTLGATYCINFQLTEEENFPPFVFHIKNIDDVLSSYKNAEKAWRRKKDGYIFLCKAELYKILYTLRNTYNRPYTPNSKQSLLEPAISYIHKHYPDESINVEKLSKLCGFSYEYFRRLFHNCYGCSPVKYINDLKLKRAKELLNSGFYTVSDTALQSGFFDVSYFSRFFKKNVGISPIEYLNSLNH